MKAGRAAALAVALLCACGSRGDINLGRLPSATAPDGEDESSSASEPLSSSGVTPSSGEADATSTPGSTTESSAASETGTRGEGTPSASTEQSASGPPDGTDSTADCLTDRLPEPAVRYDFSGTGTEVVDRMGGPSGLVVGGAALEGNGQLSLDGEDDYVDLPNRLLSVHTSATLVLWASLTDGPAYWRLLDFGTTSEGEDPTGTYVGTTYVAITTETGLEPSGLALLVGHGGASAEDRALTDLRLESDLVALGVTLDGESGTASLSVDGQVVATTTLTDPLSALDDVNNWLGRSQYAADPHYPGTYAELRVYAEALNECQLTRLVQLGPDVVR